MDQRWVLAPCLALGLISTPARAADHTVELQLPASSLLNLMRARAQSEASCPVGFQLLGELVLQDHVEFPSVSDDGQSEPRLILDAPEEDIPVSFDTTVVGHRTKAVLPTVVVFKNEACVADPSCAGARLGADLFIDISVNHDDGVRLCAVGDRFEPDLGLDAEDVVPQTCVDLPTDFGLDRLDLRMAKAALSTNGDRLAVRLTFVQEDIVHTPVGEYETFLFGQLGPGTHQTGTSLFIAENLFSSPFRKQVYDELTRGELGDWTHTSVPLSTTFDRNTPSITVAGTVTTDVCVADLEFQASTVFSYVPDGQGGHWLRSDVTDTEWFDFPAFQYCIYESASLLLGPYTAGALLNGLTALLVGKLAGNGVGSEVPSYPLDPLWTAATRLHSRGSNGVGCESDDDCHGGVCLPTFNVCFDARCSDGVKNGDETAVDCGGPSCDWCDGSSLDELYCLVDEDCESNICIDFGDDRVCGAPGCPDGRWNGLESALDCGQGTCQLCALQQECNHNDDCDSGLVCKGFCEVEDCTPRVCVAASCDNGVKDGQETWIDCGGPSCGECPSAFRINNHRIIFYTAIDLPTLTFGGVSAKPVLDQLVTGQAGGLMLTGEFDVPSPPEPVPVSASVFPIVRSMGFSGGCYDGGFADHGYQGGFQIKGGSGATMCPEYPTITNDTLGVFSMSAPSDVDLPVGYDLTLDVDLNVPNPNLDSDQNGIPDVDEPGYVPPPLDPFWAAPYDPIVLVHTTGGALTFTVPAPDVPTSWDEVYLSQMEAVGQKAVLCHVPGGHYWPGGYNPLWDIDPEYDLVISLKDARGRVSQVRTRATNLQIVAEAYTELGTSAYVTGAPLYVVGDVSLQTRSGTLQTRLVFGARADLRLERLQTVQMSLARPVRMVHSLGTLARGLGYPQAWATFTLNAADLSVP